MDLKIDKVTTIKISKSNLKSEVNLYQDLSIQCRAPLFSLFVISIGIIDDNFSIYRFDEKRGGPVNQEETGLNYY